jgi:hypothetical protein
MAETKPTRKRKSKAAAAKAEKAGGKEGHSLTWRGLNLELPADMPGDLLFSFERFEEELEAGQLRLTMFLKLLKAVLGEDQFVKVREVVRREQLTAEAIQNESSDLLEEALGHYGLSLGESSASQGS